MREIPKSHTLISPDRLNSTFFVARSRCRIPFSCMWFVASSTCRMTYLTSLNDKSCLREFRSSKRDDWQYSMTINGSPVGVCATSRICTIFSCFSLLRIQISRSKLNGKPPRMGSSLRLVTLTATVSFVSVFSAMKTLPYAPTPTFLTFLYFSAEGVPDMKLRAASVLLLLRRPSPGAGAESVCCTSGSKASALRRLLPLPGGAIS
mmetsp:Transcript_108493/g.188373  ORF Transcript_108493/g.188373 Transcript_108493/m.188373 type:complete len:206 (-) Transcript_108493:178-795(-)